MHATNVHAETVTSRVFPAIRLGDTRPVDSAAIEQHCLAVGDQHLRGLASQCVGATRKLLDQGAFASFLSQAVERAPADRITPDAWLERELQIIEAEIEQTRLEHTRYEQRRKAREDHLQPLRGEILRRWNRAEVELKALVEHVQAAGRSHLMKPQNPFQRLVDAGLSPEQIKRIGTENLEDKQATKVEAMKGRIPVLQAEIAKYQVFSADRTCNPDPLQGLEGLDELIAAARLVPEEVA